MIIVCKNSLYKLFLLSPKKIPLKIFGFSIFNIKNGCISTLVSSYRVAASFMTSKFLEHNAENEKFEKSRVLQKCPLMHITLIIIIVIIVKVHVSQFYINHLRRLNLWLVSDQGSLVLELRNLPLSYVELWSGDKPFNRILVVSNCWKEFKDF